MKRIPLLVLFFVTSSFLIAQTTTVEFVSPHTQSVYRIEKMIIEDSSKLTSSVDIQFLKMELVGKTPFSIEIPNGNYNFNIGGVQEFNRTFALVANGNRKTITIHGNIDNAKTMSYITFATGFLLAVSFNAMEELNKMLSDVNKQFTISIPIISGVAFGVSLFTWLSQMVRIEEREI